MTKDFPHNQEPKSEAINISRRNFAELSSAALGTALLPSATGAAVATAKVAAKAGGGIASAISFTPAGTIAATNVQTAIEEVANAAAIDFTSRTTAISANIKSGITAVRTRGYATGGDGGGGLYRKVIAQPSHSGKFQSVDGAWWELVDVNRVDIRQYGAKCDGSTSDTAAFQAAIDRYAGTGCTILIIGRTSIGALTWPAPPIPYRIEVMGEIILQAGATFNLQGAVDLIGISGYQAAQFPIDGTAAKVTGSSTSNPVIKVWGPFSRTIENIVIGGVYYVGLLLIGKNLAGSDTISHGLKMRNVTCESQQSNINSLPMRIDTFFWVDAYDCAFTKSEGGDYPYSIDMLQTGTLGYLGLITFKNLRMNGNGIKITGASGASSGISGPFIFEDAQIENLASGGNLLELDCGSAGQLGIIELVRPRAFDSSGYLLTNSGAAGGVRHVRVTGIDFNSAVLRPTSNRIDNLTIDGAQNYPYELPLPHAAAPEYNNEYKMFTGKAIDAIIVNAPRAPSALPAAPINIPQDPASWSALAAGGASVTTGILAPDGTLTAGQIGGTSGGSIELYNQTIGSGKTGDWYIFGAWMQSADATKLAAPPYVTSYSYDYVNATNPCKLGERYDVRSSAGGRWYWVCQGVKLGTWGGDSAANFRFYLQRTTSSGYGIANIWMPCLMCIPASDGRSDGDVVQLIRSLSAWPSLATAGCLALPAHQTFKTGTFTVANLPTAVAGTIAFATNGRKNGEGSGAGTGVLVFHDGTAWRACDTGATVAS